MNDYLKNYTRWKQNQNLEIQLKTQLSKLTESEIEDCFYKNLEFGTGGLRAVLGPGTNRLNIYTLRKNTEGFANYIETFKEEAKAQGIVIAYDNRHNSQKFAFEAAKVLANHQIKSYVFESLRPTPELSFSIRYLQAFGGIVITASHNPKEYNGYKVYNKKGCQCIPDETDIIIKHIQAVENELEVKVADSTTLNKYMMLVGDELDEAYYNAIESVQLNPELDKKNIHIVFSPQHGTSNIPVRTILDKLQYQVTIVEEQCDPDPNFSNTASPNPENPQAFDKAIEVAKKVDADLIITTDPDCDRLGIAVKHQNNYELLTGNQTGAILLDYLLSQLKGKNRLPSNGIVFNTIVTSNLGVKICENYNVEVESTLTGFKFIGDRIGYYEEKQTKQFLFGYEESYGYLIKDFARDKDAVQSTILIAEVVNYYLLKGLDLIEVLDNIYKKYGYFEDSLYSITLSGNKGNEMILKIVDYFRKTNLSDISGLKITTKEDYQSSTRYTEKETSILNLPKSNVIKYFFEDNSWLAIRPSGTEPKCKFYYSICGSNLDNCKEKLNLIQNFIEESISKIQNSN